MFAENNTCYRRHRQIINFATRVEVRLNKKGRQHYDQKLKTEAI